MHITLSDLKSTNLFIVPIVPPDVEIRTGGENQTLQTVKGNIRLVGKQILRSVAWSSIFPIQKKYSIMAVGSRLNGFEYINFLENSVKTEVPVRIVVTTSGKRSLCNMLATVDDGFSWSIDTAGDIRYSVAFTEFPEKIWGYVNASPTLTQYLKTIAVQSAAKKALSGVGLL